MSDRIGGQGPKDDDGRPLRITADVSDFQRHMRMAQAQVASFNRSLRRPWWRRRPRIIWR